MRALKQKRRQDPKSMKIISCNSNKVLAEAISSYIGVNLSNATIKKFAAYVDKRGWLYKDVK